jgi:hypothetical protein
MSNTASPMKARNADAMSGALSPPLRGRVGEGGNPNGGVRGSPPTLTLPRKGGGNVDAATRRGHAGSESAT